jgi:hypothetical protein
MRVGTTATIKVKRRRLLARRLCCRSGAPLPASPLPKALPGAPPFPFRARFSYRLCNTIWTDLALLTVPLGASPRVFKAL